MYFFMYNKYLYNEGLFLDIKENNSSNLLPVIKPNPLTKNVSKSSSFRQVINHRNHITYSFGFKKKICILRHYIFFYRIFRYWRIVSDNILNLYIIYPCKNIFFIKSHIYLMYNILTKVYQLNYCIFLHVGKLASSTLLSKILYRNDNRYSRRKRHKIISSYLQSTNSLYQKEAVSDVRLNNVSQILSKNEIHQSPSCHK